MADSNKLNWERISELYSVALEMPSEQWQSWLQTQCNDQEKKSGLDTYLLKLLKSSPRADAFFDALNQNIEEDFVRHKDMDIYKPGDTFDKFRIIREIGHGGMSKVFLCQRADGQFEQSVAIKVMKVRGDAEFMKDRFRQEQQILAGINHAHIAQLYDGGITEQGHPYIIMEYVEGEAIDLYCKKKNLGIKDKIRLFIQVCDALQYAHSKLIVHHDIKPANIMVNDQGQVKLLDFGISQVLFSQEKAEVKKTSFEGTLQYASPEQFEGAGPSVASDIYKLGLVLYNLLTGRLYNFRQEKQSFRDEIFETRAAGSASKSRHRRNSLLLSDLDAILRKCLEREPAQRFESVSTLSHDLQNTLTNHALHSHPPQLGYRLRKSYARNKAKVWMFTLFNLALLVSLVFLVSQFRQTLTEKERAEHILEFVWDVFESTDPEVMQGDTLTVYELLENSIPRIEALDKQPELQAELYYVTGRIYSKLGFWAEGIELFYKAYEINNSLPVRKEILTDRARILYEIAKMKRGLFELDVADSIIDISIELFKKYPPRENMAEIAESIRIKANIELNRGNLDESIKYCFEAIDILDDFTSEPHIIKAALQNMIATAFMFKSEYEEALDYINQAIEILDKIVPETNSFKLTAYNDYANILAQLDRLEEALEIDKELYQVKSEIYGEKNPITLLSLTNMASRYYQLKEFSKSDSLNLMLLDIYLEMFGELHERTVATYNNLGNSYFQQAKFEKALRYQKITLEADILTLGDFHHYVGASHNGIAKTHLRLGNLIESEEHFLKAIEVYKHNFGEKHHYLSEVYSHFAELFCIKNNPELCRYYFNKALQMSLEILGEGHSLTLNIKNSRDEFAAELALTE
ncbi:MAG: serine/threonine protein kinase [Bacteroidetes bacterium]|nr:MAG: serine/threonine protein kinase [Bacteroidota bacterium]